MIIEMARFDVSEILKSGDNGIMDGKCRMEPQEITAEFREACIQAMLSSGYFGPVTMYRGPDDIYHVLDGRKRLTALLEGKLDKKFMKAMSDKGVWACVVSGGADECYEYFTTSNFLGWPVEQVNLSDIIYGGAWLDEQRRNLEKADMTLVGPIGVNELTSRCVEWYANREDMSASEFMKEMQSRDDKVDLGRYYESVVNWARSVFGDEYLDRLQDEAWGMWYNDYGLATKGSDMSQRLAKLVDDPSVTNRGGIIEYLLTGDMEPLKLRKFTKKECAEKLEEQGHTCKHCGCELDEKDARISCATPWPAGAMTLDNAEVLCRKCDKAKKDRYVSVFG